MTSTTTKTLTVKDALDQADPNQLPDALSKVKLGTLLTPINKHFTALASVDTLTLDPPALYVESVRVVDGGGTGEGSYLTSDDDATASDASNLNGPGVCKISDDGATLTFASAVIVEAIVQYIPKPDTDLTDIFERS